MIDDRLPGWEVRAEHFDLGTKWGVAIRKDGRKFAVKIPDGSLTEQEAIDAAMPFLSEWAGVKNSAVL
jgi:hypothetical protein